MPVTLSNALLKLADLSPFIRNDNASGGHRSVKVGPHHIVWDGGLYRCYAEVIEDDGPGTTGMMLATASQPQGPWTFSGTTRLISPNASPNWEKSELSPSSVYWDSPGNRWVVWYNGGHNVGPRQVGVLYSTDGFTGQAFTRDAGNPIIAPGTGGSSDDKWASDLKIGRLPDGTYLGFYCGRQTGGPLNGTIHKVTGTSPASLTKQGEVIAEGGVGDWNEEGMYPSHWWLDPENRLHMICAAGSGENPPGYAGYYYSDDYGDTWTQYGSNPVMSGNASAGAYDRDSGDVGQIVHDGDLIFFTTGGENTTDYGTNPPLRGQHMAITPARVSSPVKKGKFYLPTTASQTQTGVTGTGILANATGTILIRFRAVRLQRSTQQRNLYTESAAFNIETYWRIEGGVGADAGKLTGWLRTPTTWTTTLASLAVVDDGLWHIAMIRRNSASSADLWLDGVQQDTDSTNIGTDATTTNKAVGNWNSAAAVADEPGLCTISDVLVIPNAALTWAQAIDAIYSRTLPAGVSASINFPTDGSDQGNVATVEAIGRQARSRSPLMGVF